jgi:aldehyde dehydrogenase (NAD+)
MPDMRLDPSLCLIGGRWAPAGGGTLPLLNPSTGEPLARVARGGFAEIDAAVVAAQDARTGAWGRMTAAERGRTLSRIGQLVALRVEELARLEALDVGKPLSQARADARALARYLEFYGGAADKLAARPSPTSTATPSTRCASRMGDGHIIPWNYPMQIVGRSVVAALAMGNACVLKPAEEACLTALAFAGIAEEAGLPPAR